MNPTQPPAQDQARSRRGQTMAEFALTLPILLLLMFGVIEFARYQGKGVPEGAVSLSFRLTFRAPERTLTDDEVQRATDRIVAALADSHGARLR